MPTRSTQADDALDELGSDTTRSHGSLTTTDRLSIVGAGEWVAAKHGGCGRRGWRKLHRGVDQSGVIRVHTLTEATGEDVRSSPWPWPITPSRQAGSPATTASRSESHRTGGSTPSASGPGRARVYIDDQTGALIEARVLVARARQHQIDVQGLLCPAERADPPRPTGGEPEIHEPCAIRGRQPPHQAERRRAHLLHRIVRSARSTAGSRCPVMRRTTYAATSTEHDLPRDAASVARRRSVAPG